MALIQLMIMTMGWQHIGRGNISTSPLYVSHPITANKSTIKFTVSMIEVIVNDRLGKKVRIKANPTDTVGDFKKLVAAQTGTRYEKIVLKKWYTIFKDNVTLADYEIHDGAALELYYQ